MSGFSHSEGAKRERFVITSSRFVSIEMIRAREDDIRIGLHSGHPEPFATKRSIPAHCQSRKGSISITVM